MDMGAEAGMRIPVNRIRYTRDPKLNERGKEIRSI